MSKKSQQSLQGYVTPIISTTPTEAAGAPSLEVFNPRLGAGLSNLF